ncbi:MAG: HAMP domain-containing histidine kinase [Oscillospiraceae bacterium]|nr:HAMP domain-containing histidine kinase [Oscillospiraceae bacterium]
MIKRLRVKFICYNMLIVLAMMTLLLGILTEYMQKSLLRDQYDMLYRIAEEPERRFRPRTDEEENFYPPHFLLETGKDGSFVARGDGSFDLSDEEALKALYAQVLSQQEKQGVAEDYGLRYVRMETPWGAKLVFSDMSGERATMRRLIKTSILIGVGSCGLFFVISVFLSGVAIKPVDEAWRQQKQFVSDASHELKTPLTVIMANAELLTQPGYSEEQRRGFSDSILSMSRQMRHLVESLLNLARLDSLRETESLVADMDLSSLVEDCLLPFEPLYFERGLLLETEVEPGIRVQGNEQVLRQCVDILLDNAQKYSDPGTVRVRLRRSGRQAELTLANPSPELSREECRNIFKRFYRRDTARTASGSYGLGLAIAEGIVERHKGKISCGWENGEIRFTVLIPAI